MNTIDALVAELNSQIIRLPSARPEAVEAMLTTLSVKLENLAIDVRNNELIDQDSLQEAQTLLGVYSQQLGRAMTRVQNGLEVFGLNDSVYAAPISSTNSIGLPVSIKRRSISA